MGSFDEGRKSCATVCEIKSRGFLKIINFFLNIGSRWVKSNYISTSRDYFEKALEALLHLGWFPYNRPDRTKQRIGDLRNLWKQ